MRYTNWDVLLFAESSKVPIQEFKTNCFAIPDPESSPVAPQHQSDGYTFEQSIPRQIPMVACFVPDLHSGCPFRVSIHSWETPTKTRSTQVFPRLDAVIWFEARILVDGICVGGVLFNDEGPWPKIVDMSSQVDKSGNRDHLRFPPFHQEMLMQGWWNPGESLGRIKILIAEGFIQGTQPYERLKNIVYFSFQHAPLDILESTGIAWPNARMWYQPSQPIYSFSSPLDFGIVEPDLHAHSPRRRSGLLSHSRERTVPILPSASSFFSPMPPPPAPNLRSDVKEPDWSLPSVIDPFVEHVPSFVPSRRIGRSSDEEMPDYSRPLTPASSRNTDWGGLSRPSSALQNSSCQLEELTNALDSRNTVSNETVGLAKSKVSSAANTPPIQTRPSAAAEARAASYPQMSTRTVSLTSKDLLLATRDSSDTSMKSGFSEDQVESKEQRDTKIHLRPARQVKGRKEGRGSDEILSNGRGKSLNGCVCQGQKENTKATVETTVVISDGKRKRADTVSGSGAPASIDDEEEAINSSPTRKPSRKQQRGPLSGNVVHDSSIEGTTARSPLNTLDNVQ
ncbi:hypothetical protein MMC20_005274 [Loxospora ochrophaea]|nr:hypothetical protein [Loxospora ochrophaea]